MEGAKKRKRDADLPRITYNAASRTFDRLFKEDTLEGMKDVVRKKLGVSTATPVYLAQLRDGRTVDLEDDDDFEAFSSSAYHGLTARVKVTVGIESSAAAGNGNQPPESATEGSSPKKKKKKDSKEKQNGALEIPEPTVNPQAISSDAPPPSKKRRVSFIQPTKEARNSGKSAVAGDSRTTSPEAENTPEQEPTLLGNRSTQGEGTPDAELTTEERRKKKKKTKKEKKDLEKQNELSADPPSKDGTPAEGGPQKKTKKNKAALNGADLTATSTSVEQPAKGKSTDPGNFTAPNGETDAPQTKKSKKRSRAAEAKAADEPVAGQNVTPKTSTEPEAEAAASEVRERTTKKQKKAHKANDDADGAAVNGTTPIDLPTTAPSGEAPVPKTPKKARRKSDAQLVVPASAKKQANAASEPAGSTPVAPPEIISKSKTNKASESHAPETNTSEKPAVEAKTPKKTTKKKSGLSEHTESTQQEKEILKAAMMQALRNHKIAAASKASGEIPALAETSTPAATKRLPTPAVGAAPAPPIASSGPQVTSSTEPAATPISVSAQAKSPPVIDPVLLQMSITGSSSEPLSRTGKAAAASSKATPAPKTPKADVNAKCPVCEDEPGHARPKCPIVKKGIKAMQKRIAELEKEGASEDDDEGRAGLIAELYMLIEGKRRKPRASLAKDSTTPLETNEPAADASAVKSVVDASIPSTAVNVVPPLAALASFTKSVPSIQSTLSTLPASSSQPPIPTQPPSTQPPPSTQLHSQTQPISSTQPLPSTQSKRTQNDSPKSPRTSAASLFPSPADLSLGGGSGIFALGDIASYTDRDIEALMRGPKLWSRDVPSDDGASADENDEEPVAFEEEDQEDKKATRRGPRKSSQREYPSSSDEGDDDDEDETSPQPTEYSAPAEENMGDASPAPSADGSDVLVLQRSFQEMDATNTSRSSIEHTGDAAAIAAIDADLDMRDATPLPPPPAQPPAQPPVSLVAVDDRSSTAVDGREEEEESAPKAAAAPAASVTPAPAPEAIHKDSPDPIEMIEEPAPSQPEPIASDNESPVPRESTPKETVLRARSQRNKPASSQVTTEELGNGGEEAMPKPAGRKTRSLTKISELPVPPNPSVRMIRQASAAPPPVTPRSMRLRARAESKPAEPEHADEPAVPKALAKTPARVSKTPVKPASKIAAKPALPSKAPSKAVAKAAAAAPKLVTYARSTRARRLAADLESSEERDDGVAADPEASVAAWAVLPENGESQTALSQLGSEPNTMLDELISSPDVPTKIGAEQNAKAQDPLFLASQMSSFPSSQYLARAPPSPENSDDDEEVASAVRLGRPMQSSNYRSLTEITSQPTIFAPRYSSQMANNRTREPLDMFGTSGHDDEEESQESESESEPENKSQPSHIPATRRAGAAVPRQK